MPQRVGTNQKGPNLPAPPRPAPPRPAPRCATPHQAPPHPAPHPFCITRMQVSSNTAMVFADQQRSQTNKCPRLHTLCVLVTRNKNTFVTPTLTEVAPAVSLVWYGVARGWISCGGSILLLGNFRFPVETVEIPPCAFSVQSGPFLAPSAP